MTVAKITASVAKIAAMGQLELPFTAPMTPFPIIDPSMSKKRQAVYWDAFGAAGGWDGARQAREVLEAFAKFAKGE